MPACRKDTLPRPRPAVLGSLAWARVGHARYPYRQAQRLYRALKHRSWGLEHPQPWVHPTDLGADDPLLPRRLREKLY